VRREVGKGSVVIAVQRGCSSNLFSVPYRSSLAIFAIIGLDFYKGRLDYQCFVPAEGEWESDRFRSAFLARTEIVYRRRNPSLSRSSFRPSYRRRSGERHVRVQALQWVILHARRI
jgi:hypothetical protein